MNRDSEQEEIKEAQNEKDDLLKRRKVFEHALLSKQEELHNSYVFAANVGLSQEKRNILCGGLENQIYLMKTEIEKIDKKLEGLPEQENKGVNMKKIYDGYNEPTGNPCDCLAEDALREQERIEQNSSQERIEDVLENMKDLLLYKNEKYGDSILSKEGQVFFKGDPKIRVAMHLDEKLSRIRNNPDGEPRKNDIMDLIGYLVFELIALDATRADFEKEMD